ncbi:MAG TPA: sulfurtransferase [Vicinamibacterales bacterium]|jgi:thiosulfate/3-mercaptopyruvate sulfurtransferase|nr:sulfurtransferase [Vicinamibacterales bacterium]
MQGSDLLVSPAELAGLLAATGGTQVIDLRPAEDFARGRIPGAIHLDLWAFSLNDTDPAPLKSFLWMIAHVLAARGTDPSRTVVVYDEKSGIRAARAFWFLEYFGHPDVRMLDGGFTAWSRAGLPVATGEAGLQPAAAPTSDWPERVEPRPDRLATWRDVHDRLGSKDAIILDTRSAEEYYGELVRARRGGAVPGAVHVDWTRNLDAEGAFKPREDLRAMYETAGVTPDREVVTYCQGGYRAAHSYLALRLLGYPRVRAYLGSWKEWGDREDLPIEKPSR